MDRENQGNGLSFKACEWNLDQVRGRYRQGLQKTENAARKGLSEDPTRSHAKRVRNFLHNGRQPQRYFDCTCYHPNFLFNQFCMLARDRFQRRHVLGSRPQNHPLQALGCRLGC